MSVCVIKLWNSLPLDEVMAAEPGIGHVSGGKVMGTCVELVCGTPCRLNVGMPFTAESGRFLE